MKLTTAQLAALKTFVEATPTINNIRLTGNYGGAMDALHALASPAFILWRTDVGADETGNAWLGTDIDGMISPNLQRLQLLLASSPSGVFDMTRADRRAGFENPFGAVNNASRVAMRAVWKRPASVLEKLFATGTGSDATPAVQGKDADNNHIEGQIDLQQFRGIWIAS
jgi:hypothetical protein